MTKHKIIIGDSRKMSEIDNSSVHLIVTSPPYWQLKDYGSKNQIGFDDTYEDYINNLNLVWKECYRVLHPGCRAIINIGDLFARSVYYGRYKVIPIRTEIIKFNETIGFDYMGSIIWQKKTTMNTTGGASVMGSYPFPRNGIVEIDYEFILIFKKPGQSYKVTKEIKEASKLTNDEWKEYFSGHWYFNGQRQDKHLAMFPEELPKRAIKMFTFIKDTVLDPFLGSGTTSLAAKNLSRNSIGYEINQDFLPVIKDKIGVNTPALFDNLNLDIIKQNLPKINWAQEIEKLPYIFKDPLRFDKKIDPRKLKFGSKINKTSSEKVNYYSIKNVLSPEILFLNNGITIKLIGVKENPEKKSEAIEFLRKKTKGQRLIMKYDKVKYDSNNNLMCYLYLENKTFINAHLIKHGLTNVDTSMEYGCKLKFLEYFKEQKDGKRMALK